MNHRPSYAAIAHRESFKHEVLKLSENSIRLFQVQPGSLESPISIRITQYAIYRRPPYKAISYTWGSVTNSQQILVNGRAFSIHPNLWNLLFHLRQRKETSFLWADRMCIDQDNLRERNFHVQLMGSIYDQASSVIVWLGVPAIDRTEIRAIDFVKEIAVCRSSHSDAELAKIFFASDVQHRWETLLRMCTHPYWGRTWIIQEFIRASRIELVCGKASMDWDNFENLLIFLEKTERHCMPIIAQLLKTRPARLTLRRQAKDMCTLHELLKEYHDSRCTERRDKVYGILGLASDCGDDEKGQPRGVKPDYKKHVVQVFIDAVSCIKTSVTPMLLPAAANLVRRALWLTDEDVRGFLSTSPTISIDLPLITVTPDYVGTVGYVLPTWSNSLDLRQKLGSLNWGDYVGYEVKSQRPGLGRRSSSRASHSTLADDLIQKVVNAAELETELDLLHNYPPAEGLKVASSHMLLTPLEKRCYDNSELRKPNLILEQPVRQDMMRLGFACTNTRKGDLVLQFQGLNIAVIARRLGADMILIGKAALMKHSQLGDYELDSVVEDSPWYSACPNIIDCEHFDLESNTLSLHELLTRT